MSPRKNTDQTRPWIATRQAIFNISNRNRNRNTGNTNQTRSAETTEAFALHQPVKGAWPKQGKLGTQLPFTTIAQEQEPQPRERPRHQTTLRRSPELPEHWFTTQNHTESALSSTCPQSPMTCLK